MSNVSKRLLTNIHIRFLMVSAECRGWAGYDARAAQSARIQFQAICKVRWSVDRWFVPLMNKYLAKNFGEALQRSWWNMRLRLKPTPNEKVLRA